MQGGVSDQAPPATPTGDAPPVSLADLSFMDLYVSMENVAESRFRPQKTGRGIPPNQPVPASLIGDLGLLKDEIDQHRKEEFTVIHGSMRLRASRQVMANGQRWVAMRRVSNEVPDLVSLRYDPKLLPVMQGLGKRNGLIVVAGPTGHGKTTTAIALLSEYLRAHGDLAYTIEDPAEYQLAGDHGDNGGYCFQTEVDLEEEWALGLRTALRWHPRYLLVGEVRSPDCANQLLRAATSGHLVITTMHGGSIEESLMALLQMGEAALGDRAAQLLADGLVAVFHQTLRSFGPYVRFLVTEDGNIGDPVRSAIRENKIKLLGTNIEQQEAQLFGPQARMRRLGQS